MAASDRRGQLATACWGEKILLPGCKSRKAKVLRNGITSKYFRYVVDLCIVLWRLLPRGLGCDTGGLHTQSLHRVTRPQIWN